MAARWGTGEEILTAHNVKYFSTPTQNEREALQAILAPDCVRTQDLHTGDVLEAVQGCLDPAIFSFFGDPPTGEAKIGMDVESEATLLTALTEILDNVDDENLSPFDTLPDVELLTGQRGQDLSPLRKLHSLSLSPPDRESMFHAVSFSSPAKTFSRIPGLVTQRSDGEDEEFLPLSDIDPSMDLIPIASMPLGQDGSSMSFSLGDLVKHVQCMAVCLEEGEEEGIPEGGEQILPDGGILLEVVDFGENGEPILAVPVQLDLNNAVEEESEQVSQPAKELPDQSRKGCDDQKPETSAPLNAVESASHTSSPAVDENEKAVMKRPKEEVSERCPSHRKKKRKNKEAQPPPVSEGRVLRSSTRIPPKKSEERQEKPKKMKKTVTFAPVISTLAPEQVTPITQQAAVSNSPQVKTQTPMKTVQAPLSSGLKDAIIPKSLPVVTESKSVPATESPAEPPKIKPTATPVPVTKASSLELVSVGIKEEVPEQTEVTAAPSEPKPKPLSLQQYRLLRQQKKPAPVPKTDDNSTKWPSLPEPPKELPPIPHLPQPQLQQAPKDPRRASAPYLPRNVPAPEIKEVWQPKGLAAPPTPEALLVPPASIVAASSRPVIPKPPPVQAAPSTLPPTPAAVEPTPLQVPSNPGQSPDKPLAIQNATASNVPMSAAQQPTTVYKPLPLPSATTPTASQVLKAVVSQPHISQLLAAALKGHKLPLLGPQVPTAPTPKMQAAGQASPAVSKEAVAAVDAMVSAPAATPVTAHPKPVPSPQTLVPKPLLTNVMVPTGGSQQQCSQKRESVPPSIVVPAQSVASAQCTKPAKQSQTPAVVPSKGKSHTEKLIESFTSEMGIEASDLASLLEQFEETQAKVEHRGPEVFGRAAAVGNSRVEPTMENKALEGTKVHDLSSTAGLTPPGTPPHQMWKPLMPVVQQGKSKMAESPKKTPTKLTIQIDPRPMPMSMLRSKTQPTASTRVAFHPFSADHDYCLPTEGAKSLNVEQMKMQQSSDAIKNHVVPQISKILQQPPTQQTTVDVACNKPIVSPQALEQKQALNSSVLVTPDASPSRCEPDQAAPLTQTARGISPAERASSRSPSPYCRKRGRNLRRRAPHSRSSSSSSSSSVSSSRSWSEHRSRSPPRKRCYRSRRSPSSSSSRSRSRSRSQSRSPYRRRRYSYSSSRSGSWSRSRSRSNSPESRRLWRRSGHSHRYNSSSSRDNYEDVKKRKEKAIEERRVVYVGRIRGGMTRAELKDRFSLYGDIEDCTLHFREHGDNYGFVTYYNTKDAFNAIESGSELRRPNELPFDLCFGGRRQFCKSSYADLDSNQEYDPASSKRKIDALDFDTLLKQAQKNLRR